MRLDVVKRKRRNGYLYCPSDAPLLIGKSEQHPNTWKVVKPTCGSWQCPYCRELNKTAWTKRVWWGVRIGQQRGYELSFVTLTAHENLTTLAATLSIWPKVWAKFSTRMRREFNKPEYVRTAELHGDGRIHYHMIVWANIRTRWVKNNLRSSGGGYMADSRPVSSASGAAYYVTKYMHKSIDWGKAWPANLRRINVSRGWPHVPDSEWHEEEDTWQWATTQATISGIEGQARRLGIRLHVSDSAYYNPDKP